MGQLQERVKASVIPLLDGKQSRLDEHQQMALAGWIAMAIMCSEFGRDDSVTIAQEDRTFLYRHQVPPLDNWAIWIGDYDRQEWIPEWARHVLTISEEETAETSFKIRPPLNTQSTTFTVGRLYIHCISSRFPEVVKEFRFSGADGRFLHRIWPPRSSVIYWPPRHTLADHDADRVASTFFQWLRKMGG
jgi:hypothetical protein